MIHLFRLSIAPFRKRIVFISYILFLMANLFAQQKSGVMSKGGEFIIDTNLVYHPTPWSQYAPTAAFDGTNYFVVWDDWRNQTWNIYGARMNQSGEILDAGGIALIITGSYNSKMPALVFGNSEYLLVWQEKYNGSYNVYGARVNKDGSLLDSNRIIISQATGDQISPVIAFDGINYLVVWQDRRSNYYDIYCSRISPNGVVLEPDGKVISQATGDQISPAVTFDGTNYLVVWEDQRSASSDIYGARISIIDSILILDPNGISISSASNGQKNPSIAFDGTNFFVVWEDYRSDGLGDIYCTLVNQSGIVLNPTGIAVSTSASDQKMPGVSFDGINYLVVWQDARYSSWDIYGSRVTQSGVVLDPNGYIITEAGGYQREPYISFGTEYYLVVWYDSRITEYFDIYGARVQQNGIVADTAGILISCAVNSQTNESVAFDGTNYFVVWQDDRYDNQPLYGARVNQDGIMLDSEPIFIDTNAWYPCVAYVEPNYLIVYQAEYRTEYSDIYGVRVSQSGVVLDPNGFPIMAGFNDQWHPFVTVSDTNYFVVWDDWRNSNWDIYGARVNRDGLVLDPNGIPISTAPDDQWYSSTTFGGLNYLVVWQDDRNPPNSYQDIYGARVDQSGTVLDTSGIAISTKAYDKRYPKVAFDGSNYFTVWQNYWDIYGARVNQDGVIIDSNGIIISNATERQWRPAISFEGTDFFVVWQDYRSGTSWDIRGAQVSPTGSVIDSIILSTQTRDQVSPWLVLGSGNRLFATYSGFTDYLNGKLVNTSRIWGKIIHSDDIHAPSIPILIVPLNNFCTFDTTINFIWHHSEDMGSGIQYYVLQYANNSIYYNADSICLVDTFHTMDFWDTTYYWHVKAIDNANNHGDWSETRHFIIDTHPPETPQLISPENNCWLNDTSIVFIWCPVTKMKVKYDGIRGAPIMYVLQIDTTENFINPLIVDTTQGVNDTVVFNFNGYKYYWRVKAYDLAGNQGNFSSFWTFRVDIGSPASFDLSEPIDSMALSFLRPTFIWRSSNDGLSGLKNYSVYINNSLKHINADTVWTADYDLREGYSDWYVVAYDSAGNSQQSNETWTVIIDTTPPSLVTLISPANYSYLNNSAVNFIWHKAYDNLSGIDRYLLQYALDSAFSLGLIETTLVDTALIASLSDTIYYWRVKAFDVAGNEGVFSSIWRFEIDTLTPYAPILLSPINGIILSDAVVTFEWTAVTNLATKKILYKTDCVNDMRKSEISFAPVRYIIQIDTLLSFISPLITDTLDTTTTAKFLCERFPFYWRVKAYDWAGNQSPYSNPDSFGIDTGPAIESTTIWMDTSFTGPFEILAKVTDVVSGVDSVILYFKRNEDPDWLAKTMHYATVQDWYLDSIPEVDTIVIDTVRYYIEATDILGHVAVDPPGAPVNYYSFLANYEYMILEAKVMPEFFSISLKSNPSKGGAIFHLVLPKNAIISLRIYDICGKLVGKLISGKKLAGHYEVPWYMKTSAGVYFYMLESPWQRKTGKFVITN